MAGIAASRAASVLTPLIAIPMTVGYLGAERYGIWVTISSFLALLSFADLGLGNGLLNAIADASGRDDDEAAAESISTAFVLLSAVALVLLIASFVSIQAFPWDVLFGHPEPTPREEASLALKALAVCFALTLPTSIVERVQRGYQDGLRASLWSAAAALASLAAIVIAARRHATLPWLILASSGIVPIAGLLNSIVEFTFIRPRLKPAWSKFRSTRARQLLRDGALFAILQVAAAAALASDNVVVGSVLGPAAVTDLSIPTRLFLLIGMLIGIALTPLWPAYGEARARGDREWVITALRRSLVGATAVAAVTSLLLALFASRILSAWIGTRLAPPPLLLLALAVWATVSSAGNAVAMFLNGLGMLRAQVLMAIGFAVVAVLCKFLFVASLGIAGVVWATIVAYGICSALPLVFILPRAIRTLGGWPLPQDAQGLPEEATSLK